MGMKRHTFFNAFSSAIAVLGIAGATAAAGDEDAISREPLQLEEITVVGDRIERSEVDSPIAVGSVGTDQIQLGRQQHSMGESLGPIPGLYIQSQYNYAQDLRMSIRGFGARSDFGIRGIKIFTDGIPNTLPDGQSNVDDLDLGSAQRMEVIRGPSSSVHGPAAGGVVNIVTEDGPEDPFLEGRSTFGSYDYDKHQVKGGGQDKRLNYLANLSYLSYGGYREHSTTRSSLLNTKFRYDLGESSDVTVVLNALDTPKALDAGALNEGEVQDDRRQAAPRALQFDAGEIVEQQKLGVVYRNTLAVARRLALRGYYVGRQFDNFLPFGVNSNGQGGSVDLDRRFFGGGGDYTFSGPLFGRTNNLVVGAEIDAQRDERKRFANSFGERGALTTDQNEDVTGYAVYLQDEFHVREDLRLTVGLRYDVLEYDVEDKVGNGSGSRTFDQISPMVGLLWNIGPSTNLYGNVSTSFEPPTTTELANPLGATGFNQSLEAQTAVNYEIGIKGLLPAKSRYDVALFHIDLEDELVPFELQGSGQTFFENAGRSTRNGLEASLVIEPWAGLSTTFTYTYSDFRFDRFSDVNGNVFDGNKTPGVPDNLFYVDVTYFHSSGFYASGDVLYSGSFFADNANAVKIDSYTLANLRFGYIHETGGWEISPFIGLRNILGEQYNDNIRINASFGRYFEPAPEFNAYGGITVRYDFGW
jgi:iron complex outermembrane receptor protein